MHISIPINDTDMFIYVNIGVNPEPEPGSTQPTPPAKTTYTPHPLGIHTYVKSLDDRSGFTWGCIPRHPEPWTLTPKPETGSTQCASHRFS